MALEEFLGHKTSRIYYSKWLTQSKKDKLNQIFAEYNSARDYISKKLPCKEVISRAEMNVGRIFSQEVELSYKRYLEDGGRLSRPLYALAYRDYVHAVLNNLKHMGKDNFKAPKFNERQIMFIPRMEKSSFFSTLNCYDFGSPEHLSEFDFFFKLTSYEIDQESGYDSWESIVLPLKRHRHFNKLFKGGNCIFKVILTDKYVEFTFERGIMKDRTKKEVLQISKNGNIRTSEGDRIKLDLKEIAGLDENDAAIFPIQTKSAYKQLKQQVKTKLSKHVDFESLYEMTLDYRAVGQYYLLCSLCKRIIKELCEVNRVHFTDSFSRKGRRHNNSKKHSSCRTQKCESQ